MLRRTLVLILALIALGVLPAAEVLASYWGCFICLESGTIVSTSKKC